MITGNVKTALDAVMASKDEAELEVALAELQEFALLQACANHVQEFGMGPPAGTFIGFDKEGNMIIEREDGVRVIYFT